MVVNGEQRYIYPIQPWVYFILHIQYTQYMYILIIFIITTAVTIVLGEFLLIIGVVEGWLVGWRCYEIMYLVKSRNDRMRGQSTIYYGFWRTVYSNGFGNTLCLRWPCLHCMYCTPSYSSYSLPLTCSTEQHYLFSHVHYDDLQLSIRVSSL